MVLHSNCFRASTRQKLLQQRASVACSSISVVVMVRTSSICIVVVPHVIASVHIISSRHSLHLQIGCSNALRVCIMSWHRWREFRSKSRQHGEVLPHIWHYSVDLQLVIHNVSAELHSVEQSARGLADFSEHLYSCSGVRGWQFSNSAPYVLDL